MTAQTEANTVRQWNEAHPERRPFTAWPSGEQAPTDWDRGFVLRANGTVGPCLHWSWTGGPMDTIGYRRIGGAA